MHDQLITEDGSGRHDERSFDELVAMAVVGSVGEVDVGDRLTPSQLQRHGPSVGVPPRSTHVAPSEDAFLGVVRNCSAASQARTASDRRPADAPSAGRESGRNRDPP